MIKKILSFTLVLALLCVLAPQFSTNVSAAGTSGSCGDNLIWFFDKSSGTLTISGSGEMKNMDDIDSAPWNSFKEEILNLIVQPGVSRIGDFAFSGCNHLSSVSFPDSLQSFGAYAFSQTGLKTIAIPKGVTQISIGLFTECHGLQEVTLHNKINYIGISAFSGCSNLKNIELPKIVDTVCDGAFKDCASLEHISLPSLTGIPDYCFEGCSSLSDITLCPDLKTIGTFSFRGCTSLKKITLPASTEWIRDHAFVNTGLTSITIPYGMKLISENAIGFGTGAAAPENFTIYGFAGTVGESYASKNNIRFVPIDGTIDAFFDVPDQAFYREAVGWAVENDVTKGIRPDAFAPNDVCTRAQVVTFLWRAMGSPEPNVKSCPFYDVGEKSYYRKAVLWALENEITTGTSSNTFSPDMGCTRGQVVTFLWRTAHSPAPGNTDTGFTDVAPKAFYAKAVAWAVESKITKGMTDTTFAPEDTCTRGQIVTFLFRALC